MTQGFSGLGGLATGNGDDGSDLSADALPRDETYGLVSQLRRAAVSVASNIAEGRGRLTEGEFRQFLGLAQGSNYEVQTQILVARQLEMGEVKLRDEAQSLSIEVGKMLSALIASLGAGS